MQIYCILNQETRKQKEQSKAKRCVYTHMYMIGERRTYKLEMDSHDKKSEGQNQEFGRN